MNISVIIPAYNAQTTLVETLASVLGQTRSPDEIIVVDDGSTDATADIAAAASVRVIRQANSGPAIALNAGVAQATGDLLGFVDADDLWTNEKLALQSTMLEEQCEFDGVGGFVSEFLCPRNDPYDNARYRLSLPEPGWLTGALLLRRQCFDRCGNFAADLYAGYSIDWYDRAREAGLIFGMVPEVVLHRRIHPGSLSHPSRRRDASMVEVARRAIERRRRRAP